MARERSKGCPGRLYYKLQSPPSMLGPTRPPRCPCLWTDFIIKANFKSLMTDMVKNDVDFGYQLLRLSKLF